MHVVTSQRPSKSLGTKPYTYPVTLRLESLSLSTVYLPRQPTNQPHNAMTPSLTHHAVSLLATAIAASVGYYIGKSSGLGKSSVVHKLQAKAPTSEDEFMPKTAREVSSGDGGDDDDSDEGDSEDVSTFPDNDEDCKMVILSLSPSSLPPPPPLTCRLSWQVFVVRTDLGMTKGKIAAQCGHAALMCYKRALRLAPNLVRRWEARGQTKIAVQLGGDGGEAALEELLATAVSLGVVARVVHDAGRTQIAAGSATVLGLGPGLFHSRSVRLWGGAGGGGFFLLTDG